MNNYDDLLGIPYESGNKDCYGLARKYYKKNYQLEMANYARPFGFSLNGLDLISKYMISEGFEPVDVSLNRLEIGDGIVMAITGSSLANHIGVYVGNNFLLHHLYMGKSKAENFSDNWKRRVLTVVRNEKVMAINAAKPMPTINILDLMPPHVRAKYIT